MDRIYFSIPRGYVHKTRLAIRGLERDEWNPEQSGKELYEGLMQYLDNVPTGTVHEFYRLMRKRLDDRLKGPR